MGAVFRMDRILGLGLSEVQEREVELDEETRKLVDQRETARKQRDFKKADEIRALLLSKGIEVQDITGSHLDMLKEPNVRVLAEKLRACLDRVQFQP